MVHCENCGYEVETVEENGGVYCVECGRQFEDNQFTSDLQFQRGPDGEGGIMGQFVGENGRVGGRFRGGWGGGNQGDSQETALNRGRNEIVALVNNLKINPNSDAIEAATRLYKLAMTKGFTRGRRVSQVAAGCLYIFCRQERKAYMLIDFSDQLGVNLFDLGAVYLHLLRLFKLDSMPIFTKPIDPSLYLHRFVERLNFNEKKQVVAGTALKLVQSMKRDWMQTGRRPSGICGAALFIASHIHGCERSKQDILEVVHVGWGTLEKRVVEFAQSNVGDLTVSAFEELTTAYHKDKEMLMLEYEKKYEEAQARKASQGTAAGTSRGDARTNADAANDGDEEGAGKEIIDAEAEAERKKLAVLKEKERTGACEHVEAGDVAFAHGMCRHCFEEYLDVSGGVYSESINPPAFTQGVLRELRKQVLSLPLGLAGEQGGEAQGSGGADAGAAADADIAEELTDLNAVVKNIISHAHGVQQQTSEGAAAGPSTAKRKGAAQDSDSDSDSDAESDAEEEEGAAGKGKRDNKQGAAEAEGGAAGSSKGQGGSEVQKAAAGKKVGLAPETPQGAGPGGSAAAATAEAAAAAVAAAAAGAVGGGAGGGEAAQQVAKGEGLDRALVVSGTGKEVEVVEEPIDTLSDVDDEEVEVYLASKEEAEVKEMLWMEMNRDWLEKQEAKAKAKLEAEIAGPKTKRAHNRKNKAQLAADTAEDAAKNMLNDKKLSEKINHEALKELFTDFDTDRGGRSTRAGSQEPQEGDGGGQGSDGDGGDDAGEGGKKKRAKTAAFDWGEDEEPKVTVAMRKRAEAQAKKQAQESSRLKLALAQEQNKRGGGGLGGGFLSSLGSLGAGGSEVGASAGGKGRPLSLGSLKRTRGS